MREKSLSASVSFKGHRSMKNRFISLSSYTTIALCHGNFNSEIQHGISQQYQLRGRGVELWVPAHVCFLLPLTGPDFVKGAIEREKRYNHDKEQVARSCGPLLTKVSITCLMISAILFFSLLQFPQSFAQVTPNSLSIQTSGDGLARVTEEITPSRTVSRITVSTIANNVSNILAVDENNIVLSFSYAGSSIVIDTLGAANVTLTYSASIISKAASDIWEISYNSGGIESTIVLPSNSDIIYVNDIPIDIVDNVVTMPPGVTVLRYTVKSVDTKDLVVAWDGRDYIVHVVTASVVQEFSFEQGSKSLALTLDTSTPMLAIVPVALLGGPYSVTGAAGDPVDFKQYYQNGTHSWIRVEANSGNAVRITGTTVVPEFPLLILSAGAAVALGSLLSFLSKRSTYWR